MTNSTRTAALVLLLASVANAQSGKDVDWPSYGNDAGGSHYSAIADINRGNVSRLLPVWTYHTGSVASTAELGGKAAFEATPLMAGGLLYVITPFNKVIALDPATGLERWSFDPKIDQSHGYSEVTSRGVSYWKAKGGACAARIIFGTLDARLIALDARTGKPCAGFGKEGQVDLNIDADAKRYGDYQVTSPPAIVGDTIVVGSSIGDGWSVDTVRGVVRAFDVRNGALRWSFDPLRATTEGFRAGAANAWSLISADAQRGLVFVPTSSPSPDFFGGLRPGENRHANSVVALDARSGKVVWHFQVVHHDLWDYDVASQPILIKWRRGKDSVPAVAVTTKMGHLFVLDRLTGKPLIPVEERPVPKSDIAGEESSPTQPFPSNPPLTPTRLTVDDMWGATPEDRDWCRQRFPQLRYEGIFTPPSLKGSLNFPGNVGGVAWGGASYDPQRGLLVANVNRLPFVVRLVPRDSFAAERTKGRENRLRGEFGPQRGAAFGMYREPFLSPSGLPCIAPPWGTMVAVDLQSGAHRWSVPLGKLASFDGTFALGGSLITAGGLVFISATIRDDTFRAFDIETGKVLWEASLPAGGQATPMTYRHRGKQYVVISAGGHGKAGSKQGDSVIAYALP